jgi:hypothetical protein
LLAGSPATAASPPRAGALLPSVRPFVPLEVTGRRPDGTERAVAGPMPDAS